MAPGAARRSGGSAEPARPADPAALPGAQSRPGGAAPITKPPSEMGPTEALFDAVNRDDIAAAREAVSRGADLNEHNLLGLTALDLAVDLGHNDIAFLLLSMRGSEAPSGGAKPAAIARSHPPVVPAPATATKAAQAPSAARPAAPQRNATDGGAPIPNAGFLGFDAGR
jgi:ankyrin repeat protein